MAISVKDIQEKEFGYQKANGYNVEEVDDFLDAIAEQLGALIRENLGLKEQAKKLGAELEAAKAAPAPVEEKKDVSGIDDEAYFKNLQNALRESLIGSQRIADETTAEARRQAEQIVADAQAQAAKLVADANAELGAAKAETESVRKAADEHRAAFRKLIDEQMELCKNASALLN